MLRFRGVVAVLWWLGKTLRLPASQVLAACFAGCMSCTEVLLLDVDKECECNLMSTVIVGLWDRFLLSCVDLQASVSSAVGLPLESNLIQVHSSLLCPRCLYPLA